MTDPMARAREIVKAWQTRHTTRVRVLGELDKDELIDDIAAALTPAVGEKKRDDVTCSWCGRLIPMACPTEPDQLAIPAGHTTEGEVLPIHELHGNPRIGRCPGSHRPTRRVGSGGGSER